jgi:mannose-6-phosphate isomerase
MQKICLMRNPVQEYAWGSRTAIANLLGLLSPSTVPQAELWMGAHPKAPSEVWVGDRWISLSELISQHPSDILGDPVSERFNRELPYLFKVLAAEKPLSIQAHPTQLQAQEGFERENGLGIPLTAGHRNYRDPNHKPECICALEKDFLALNGFREIPEINALLDPICPSFLEADLARLKARPDAQSLKEFYRKMITLEGDPKKETIEHALSRTQILSDKNEAYYWMLQLASAYPNDVGVFAPIWLNIVWLKPGEAMYLPAGELHAYLKGIGIELMANSDNVLRGGLTPKHIDEAELMKVLNFEPRRIQKLIPEQTRPNEFSYPSQADEFVLSFINIRETSGYQSAARRSIDILLCTGGEATVSEPIGGDHISLKKGSAIMVPAATPRYILNGSAQLFKASVPISA